MSMSYAEPSPVLRNAARQRTLLLAWLTLLFFFALFAGMLSWVLWTGREVYRTATESREAVLIVRGRAEAIAWRPAHRTVYQAPRDQQPLAEGDSVRIVASAGYGQLASVRLFEESQLDLWAGAEMSIEALRTSRWHSGTLEIAIRQRAGYVRYDIKPNQRYEQARYTVRVADALLDLAPGGSYSVELLPPERAVLRPDGGNPFSADVAVRSGVAVVHGTDGRSVEVRPRERIVLDPAGVPGLVVPARWELIRDGGFSQFSEVEYNNTTRQDEPTLPRATTWRVYSGPELPLEQQGFFRLSSICRPQLPEGSCGPDDRRVAAWFYRPGNQTSGFTTGIKQDLGARGEGIDISEYRSLRFSLWARILYQSLNDVGDRGTECPVMIRLVAKRNSPADPEEERVVCVYSDNDDQPPRVTQPGVIYIPIERAAWANISFDLRDEEWLPDYRLLRSIEIYANGHDYDSRVTEVSLIGEQ